MRIRQKLMSDERRSHKYLERRYPKRDRHNWVVGMERVIGVESHQCTFSRTVIIHGQRGAPLPCS